MQKKPSKILPQSHKVLFSWFFLVLTKEITNFKKIPDIGIDRRLSAVAFWFALLNVAAASDKDTFEVLISSTKFMLQFI